MSDERTCYTAREVAHMLRMSPDNIYRAGVLDKLYELGMPRSLTLGRLRFPKPAFDAWFNQDHPLMPKRPANDVEAPLAPAGNAEWQAFLSANYGRRENA